MMFVFVWRITDIAIDSAVDSSWTYACQNALDWKT